ncbi:hypothetical protein EE612_057334 [Oryza sativa]|nr:hypothetical protein EE612_057334 [Oryza sativa]
MMGSAQDWAFGWQPWDGTGTGGPAPTTLP